MGFSQCVWSKLVGLVFSVGGPDAELRRVTEMYPELGFPERRVVELLERGADPNAVVDKESGITALMWAAGRSDTSSSLVKAMLDHGGDATLVDGSGHGPIWHATRDAFKVCRWPGHVEAIRLLREAGCGERDLYAHLPPCPPGDG